MAHEFFVELEDRRDHVSNEKDTSIRRDYGLERETIVFRSIIHWSLRYFDLRAGYMTRDFYNHKFQFYTILELQDHHS